MAVIFVEGFDAYNGANNITATAVGLVSRWSVFNMIPFTGRFGGQGVAFAGGQNTARGVTTPVNGTNTGTLGFAYYNGGIPDTTDWTLAGFYNDSFTFGSSQLSLAVGIGGAIRVYRGTTLLATAPTRLVLGTWTYIEFEFFIADTGGFFNLYFNGALDLSVSGIDTRNSATTDTYNILGLGTSTSGFSTGYSPGFDDVYLTNTATRLGEQRVVTVVPTSDGTPSQWAASGGVVPPYTMVDEVLCNGDVDYIFDGTVNDRAVFNMASTGATPVSVSAVQIGTFTRKTDTGMRAIQLQYVDSGGTAYDSASQTLGTNYARQVSLLENNPSTSAAWTTAAVNTLKTGVKVSV